MSGFLEDDIVIGRRVKVEQRVLARRDGRRELREVVIHPGSVVLLPLLADGRIVMIRNHRFAVERTLLELPAGTREANEAPELCAARELEEETGYRAGALREVIGFFPAPGSSTERMQLFIAEDLTKCAQNLDQTEQIEVVPMALDEALEHIRDNRIEDAKSIASLLYFHTFLRS
jgi:ADP-ribose pyrophosphatase